MAAFTDAVEEVRRRIDIVDLVSQDVALRKSGRNLKGLCPFHSEKTPSFHVNPERQIWKCFGCGAGGDIFSYVQKRDNMTFSEALEWLARKAGVSIERTGRAGRAQSEKEKILRINAVACEFFQEMLLRSEKARAYLAERGIGESAVGKYKLGYAPDSWDALTEYLSRKQISLSDAAKAGLVIARGGSEGYYDRFRDRLIFPIFDTSERVVGFGGRTLGGDSAKYINSPESLVFAKNKTLYGLNFARRAIVEQDRVIVVEGYMDAIAAQEAGFENTVATMGTALTEDHVNILARFSRNAILAFDADSAGMAAALRSSSFFERAGFNVRILVMPKGEDPDSLLRRGDRSRFASMVEKALPVIDYKVKLALAGHDLRTDEGKTAALRSAAAVLAEVESAVERERLIKYLAKYHPNFSTGTTRAEDDIRSEVELLRRRLSRTGEASRVREDSSQQRAAKPNLLERLEKIVLGTIIAEKVEAGKVFEVLPAKDFTGESTRQLAEALYSQFVELGKIKPESLTTQLAGTPAGDLLTDLTIGFDESELNHPFEEVVRAIEREKKKLRHARMRALARKFQEGVIKKGDEEFEEYWRLVRELKGIGVDNSARDSESDG
ncbi:MAG: DNA primase [Armatimonadota bacterium]|nr:DNA primase [Armatimonadota bacterium]